MIDASESKPNHNPSAGKFSKVRDVADFHLRWAEFRPVALGLGRSPGLTEAEANTLGWMIELLDRIGPKDIEGGET